jgi:competence protein ComEC
MGIGLIPRVLAFTAGVLLVHGLAALPSAALLGAVALPAVLPWRGRRLWAALAFGVLFTTWRAQALLDQRWPTALHGTDHVVSGRIATLPEREGGNWRFLFEPDAAAAPGRIRVGWYRTDQPLRGGECWRLTLRLRTPHGSLNPGGFDYEGWLFRQGIVASGTVRDAERCEPASRDRILEWRDAMAQAIRAALPEHPSTGLLVALTVGDQSAVSGADWELFRLTGTSHLVAISGFNIAIVAGFTFFACRWLWALWPRLCLWLPAQRAALAGSALCAGLYALLAGFEPPVQRAVLMLWIVLAALSSHRLTQPARALAVAWVAVLLLDPLAIASPGLWLSFGAVAAIFYVSLGRLRPPGAWHGLVLLQLLIALALAPISLFFFHGTSWVAPLVNLLAVPFFTVLTPWVLGAALLLVGWPAAGLPLLRVAAEALALFHAALEWTAQLPGLWIAVSPPPAALLLAGVGCALLFAPRGLRLRPLALACLLPVFLTFTRPVRAPLELTALDVGQGLAVVVRTARHTLVYDAGPAFKDGFDAGASVVAPFLLQQGLRDVDLLLVSHDDNDHRGGAAAVRRLLRVRREIGTPAGEPCRDGERWDWDGVAFEVLGGPAPGRSKNDGSCVLRIVAPGLTVLLPADIEADTEARLVAVHGARLRADVLLAPHHGSRTSSTPAFVATVRPALVIHSAGWRNPFRHPRPEVTARYAAAGAAQHVTGVGGAIAVWRDAATGRLEVREHRREAARFWNAPAAP